VIYQKNVRVNSLPSSSTRGYQNSDYVKELVEVYFKDIPRNADLEFNFHYTNGGRPINRKMFLRVMNDAPTA